MDIFNKSDFEKTFNHFLRTKQFARRSFKEFFGVFPIDLQIDFFQSLYQIPILSHTNPVKCLSASPNEQFLASASTSSTLIIWDLQKIKQLQTIKNIGSEIFSLKFTLDSQSLLVGCKNARIYLFGIASWTPLKCFYGEYGGVLNICTIPGSQLFISSSMNTNLVLWDLNSAKIEAVFDEHLKFVTSLAVSPNGKFAASGSYDKSVIVWSIDKKQVYKCIPNYTHSIDSLAFTLAGNTLIVTSGKTVFIHDLNTEFSSKIESFSCNIPKVFSIDSEKIILISNDKTIRLWDHKDVKELWTISVSPLFSTSLDYISRDKKAVIGLNKGQIATIDILNTSDLAFFPGHNREICLALLSPDCLLLVSICFDNFFCVWQVRNSQQIFSRKTENSVNCMSFSNDSRYLAVGYQSNVIEILEINGFTVFKSVTRHVASISAVRFVFGGFLVSCSEDSQVCFWDSEVEKCSVISSEGPKFCIKVVHFGNEYIICEYKTNVVKCFKVKLNREKVV